MPALLLWQLRYRDPLTGKWTKARYRAELHDIQQRYWEWETIGRPEIREQTGGDTFNPFRPRASGSKFPPTATVPHPTRREPDKRRFLFK